MIESKFLEKFKRLQENASDKFSLIGGKILIERIDEPELKTEGGLIIGNYKSQKVTAHDKKSELGIVLLVGSGYMDEKGEEIPVDIKAGEIIMLPSNVSYYSTFPGLTGVTENILGIVQESHVFFKFGSIDDFKTCSQVLNGWESL